MTTVIGGISTAAGVSGWIHLFRPNILIRSDLRRGDNLIINKWCIRLFGWGLPTLYRCIGSSFRSHRWKPRRDNRSSQTSSKFNTNHAGAKRTRKVATTYKAESESSKKHRVEKIGPDTSVIYRRGENSTQGKVANQSTFHANHINRGDAVKNVKRPRRSRSNNGLGR
jgi:hypothetical protein